MGVALDSSYEMVPASAEGNQSNGDTISLVRSLTIAETGMTKAE